MTTTKAETTQDMRDLLIRIDEKVKSGFETTNAKLDAMDRRAEGHEQRLQKLELRVHTIETTAKNGASAREWLWRILGPVVTAGVVFIATLYFTQGSPDRPISQASAERLSR